MNTSRSSRIIHPPVRPSRPLFGSRIAACAFFQLQSAFTVTSVMFVYRFPA